MLPISRVASKFQILKLAINALNNTKLGKTNTQLTEHKHATKHVGIGSSRNQTQNKSKVVLAESRRTLATEAMKGLAEIDMVTPSNNRQITSSKKTRENSRIIDADVSPEYIMWLDIFKYFNIGSKKRAY